VWFGGGDTLLFRFHANTESEQCPPNFLFSKRRCTKILHTTNPQKFFKSNNFGAYYVYKIGQTAEGCNKNVKRFFSFRVRSGQERMVSFVFWFSNGFLVF
jgi:hypothetical protein